MGKSGPLNLKNHPVILSQRTRTEIKIGIGSQSKTSHELRAARKHATMMRQNIAFLKRLKDGTGMKNLGTSQQEPPKIKNLIEVSLQNPIPREINHRKADALLFGEKRLATKISTNKI
jgi:hypothetical protein